jgi:hypothetical protein
MLDGEAETIVRKVIASAKRGDATALRLCFERIFPTRKGRAVQFPLPPIKTAGDIVSIGGRHNGRVGRSTFVTVQITDAGTPSYAGPAAVGAVS